MVMVSSSVLGRGTYERTDVEIGIPLVCSIIATILSIFMREYPLQK